MRKCVAQQTRCYPYMKLNRWQIAIVALGLAGILVVTLNLSGVRLWRSPPSQETSSRTIAQKLCGPICLSRVAADFGINVSPEAIARVAGTDETGTSMLGLARAAQQLGLNAKGYRMTLDHLQQNRGPFIVHTHDDHFVVVYEIKGEDVHLFEPASLSDEVQPVSDFMKRWDGTVLIVRR